MSTKSQEQAAESFQPKSTETGTEALLINEQLVSLFKFWMSGQVQVGMRYRNKFFRLASVFDNYNRHQAFELAWTLSRPSEQVIITTTGSEYKIWMELKSLEA